MTRKTTESDGKHTNRAQTERRFKPKEVTSQTLLDACQSPIAPRSRLDSDAITYCNHRVGTIGS